MHNSQVQSSYNHFHYIYLSPPTAAHRLNILVKFFGPAGVQTPVYKQCTNLQIFRYLDRQKTGRQKKMAARTICGGYATIECYLKLTSPGSGLSCLPCQKSPKTLRKLHIMSQLNAAKVCPEIRGDRHRESDLQIFCSQKDS